MTNVIFVNYLSTHMTHQKASHKFLVWTFLVQNSQQQARAAVCFLFSCSIHAPYALS